MKALTLTQPWATLMALRAKEIETRSWYTAYRGELVIHSAKGFPAVAKDQCLRPEFVKALHGFSSETLPLSRVLCVVKLLACIPTTQLHKVEVALGRKPNVNEVNFGDYSGGRYAWVTQYVRPLELDEPVRGSLGLWEWIGADPS